MDSVTASVYKFGPTVPGMRVSGKTTELTGTDDSCILMEMCMRETG